MADRSRHRAGRWKRHAHAVEPTQGTASAGRSSVDRTGAARRAQSLAPRTTTVIVGHEAKIVEHALGHHPGLRFVKQEPQLGTAHALLQAASLFAGTQGKSDRPVRGRSPHETRNAHPSCEDPRSVGGCRDGPDRSPRTSVRLRACDSTERTVRADCRGRRRPPPEQRAVQEVNSGIYIYDLGLLFETLPLIPEARPKHERYLPAVLASFCRRGLTVETVVTEDPGEIRGINSQTELAEVGTMVRQSKNEELMAAGVTIEDPATTYIEDYVGVGPDTVIHPGVTLEGTHDGGGPAANFIPEFESLTRPSKMT